jgi:hypothetical protein
LAAVADEVVRRERAGRGPVDLRSTDVQLHADGSVTIDPPATHPDGPGVDPGAALGRLLFQMMVGRPPLSADDAFEPHLRSRLEPSTIALVSSSCSDAPGQWPPAAAWSAELTRIAGPLLAPPAPRRVASERRRRAVLAIALAVLAAVSLVVVLAAPSWWADATDEGGSTVDQPLARS